MVNSGYQPDTKSPSARRADFELLRRIAKLERDGGGGTEGPKGDKGDKGDTGDTGATGPAGVVQAVVAGTNITVNNTDPTHPVVASTAGGGAPTTPTIWTPTITGITLGNGTRNAYYVKHGLFCTISYFLRFGTSTTVPTFGWSFTLPFPALNWGYTGGGYVFDISLDQTRPIVISSTTLTLAGISLLGYATNESTYAHLGPSTPWTWGVNDEFAFEMTYLTAS